MHDHSLIKPLMTVACVTALLLLVPAVAMQFTSEVRWGLEDFVAAATLLLGTGVGIVLAARHARSTRQRVVLIGLLALTLAVVWAELAVGLFP